MLQNVSKCLGPGLILWHNLSNAKKDMRFGTWNVRSLQGKCNQVSRGEFEKYKLDLVGVKEIRWEGEGCQIADNYKFSMERGILITT
jgi:hypothetical protein